MHDGVYQSAGSICQSINPAMSFPAPRSRVSDISQNPTHGMRYRRCGAHVSVTYPCTLDPHPRPGIHFWDHGTFFRPIMMRPASLFEEGSASHCGSLCCQNNIQLRQDCNSIRHQEDLLSQSGMIHPVDLPLTQITLRAISILCLVISVPPAIASEWESC
jgi:hypothetical protein